MHKACYASFILKHRLPPKILVEVHRERHRVTDNNDVYSLFNLVTFENIKTEIFLYPQKSYNGVLDFLMFHT